MDWLISDYAAVWAAEQNRQEEDPMELGAFSISLTVKDLEVSKSFYEKLGFQVFGGDAAQNWLIMKNGDHTISGNVRKKYHDLQSWLGQKQR